MAETPGKVGVVVRVGHQGEGWQPGLNDQGKIPQGLGKNRPAQHLMVYRR